MELVKITLNNLETFCASEQFQQFTTKPISPLRMKSYIANPRSKDTDVVLYMLVEKNELIAFRTIFADLAFEEDEIIRFGWCSGVWVDPKHRGKQLWKPLLTEALADWDNRLMFTNYAPNNKDLYLRSGLFKEIEHRSGYRFYLNPDFCEIAGDRIPGNFLKTLIRPINWIASTLFTSKQSFLKMNPYVKYTIIDKPDKSCQKLIKELNPLYVFQRGMKEFDWIFDHPWVTNHKDKDFHYPFSYDGIDYQIKTAKCFFGKEMAGFFIYSIVNRKMKLLYYYEKSEMAIGGVITIPIIQIAIQERVSHLTVLSPRLSSFIKQTPGSYLFCKPFESNIYSSFEVYTDGNSYFEGDGDVCFT